MNILTAAQRGDLAEDMLPVAAHLAVLVHGDGGPEDVRDVLEGLSAAQKDALLVVLAGLVDPEQPVGKALGWLDFNEDGALTVPAWQDTSTLRGIADEVEPDLEDDDLFIDEVAVRQHVQGKTLHVTPRERLEAVARGVRQGMSYPDFDVMYGLRKGSTSTFVSRMRKRLIDRGETVPELGRPDAVHLTEEQVVAIREKSAGGATDLDLALSYGLAKNTIGQICRGKAYPKVGGPIRTARTAHSLQASRQVMCGHAANSQAANKKHEMGEAA